MAKPFRELLGDLSPSDLQDIDEEARTLLIEYELLRDLRVANTITQQQLADLMEVRQASISKLERQDDFLVSTLRRYVEALGGHLQIRAQFGDRAVVLTRFSSEGAAHPSGREAVPG